MNKLEVRAIAAPWNQGIEVLIRHGDGYVSDIIFTEEPEGQIVKPSLTFDMGVAQTLMDDLWHAGLRPTEGAGSAGAMLATKNHLNDMRAIVFDKLKVERP